MQKNRLFAFLVLFLLGVIVFLLPIREYDHMRLRYFLGIWFFAEAAYLVAQGETRTTPLYQLVMRYPSARDRIVAGSALAAFFIVLFLAVRFGMENELSWGEKLALAIGTILASWLVYYGLCCLLGSEALRAGIRPDFLKRAPRRIGKE